MNHLRLQFSAEEGEKDNSGLTLYLEQQALARGDLSAGLSHTSECDGYFLFIAARDAVCEDVDVVSVCEEIER
jgi:hypothetical protein